MPALNAVAGPRLPIEPLAAAGDGTIAYLVP